MVQPRLWTPPLRPLTPETSAGFDQVDYARNVLGHPFDPWQEFVVVHAGELLPDGRPRFRLVLVVVSRQNGKTEIPVVLSLYWLAVDGWPVVLGTSTKLDYAQESWEKAIKIARRTPSVARRIPRRGGIRRANGEQVLKIIPDPARPDEECRYKIAASNEEGGRSLTIDRLVLDELRQHHSYLAYGASEPAVSARPLGQIWALSNAGDDRSVVLNDTRADALAFLAWWERHGNAQVAADLLAGHRPPGMPDFRIGIFEYSAPYEGAKLLFDPDDDDDVMAALLQANPNAGHPQHGADPDELLASYKRARAAGGEQWSTFLTERMCVRVHTVDAAVDAAAWRRGATGADLADLQAWPGGVAALVDVSPDLEHATLICAALADPADPATSVAGVDVAAAWDGPTAVREMTRDLPGLLDQIRPAVFGWLPSGPAAAAAATLKDRARKGGRARVWPPRWLTTVEIQAEVTAVCMSFAADVKAGLVRHNDDPLLNAHVEGADKLIRGDVWRFARDGGHCDAAYAAGGAVYLARTLPADPGPLKLVVHYDE